MKYKIISVLFLINACTFAATAINPGASFETGFSPNGNSLAVVLTGIESAKKSIHVAAYSFTSKPIATALYMASLRGVDVKIIADKKSNSGKYSAVNYLANHNVPVRLNGNYPIFHHKFMVIDGVSLETGSFNYSAAAANKNAENVLLLWNVPQVAENYDNQWNKLWNEAKPVNKRY